MSTANAKGANEGKRNQVEGASAKPGPSSYFTVANLKRGYLILYNVLSTIGWSYILIYTSLHVLGFLPSSNPPHVQTTAAVAATTTFQRLLSKIPFFAPSSPIEQFKVKAVSSIPPVLLPYFNRTKTLYPVLGVQLAIVQSVAVLEVLHVLIGLVRSPLTTTAMQVSSRLFLVWGIVERFEDARSNPIFTSMVLAWSVTEVIRYAYYASSLSGFEPYALLWLRYTTFYVLYPLGAGSEAFLILSTVPISTSPFSTTSPFFKKQWSVEDYVRSVFFLIWWPGLFIMFTHMMKQRAKVLGGGKRLGGRPNGEKKKTK